MIDDKQAQDQESLDWLSVALAEKRKEAIDARKASGIEEVWMAAEEAYIGMDDANRHEFKDARWAKPTSMQGTVTSEQYGRDDSRSNAFVRLTARYVDAGTAKLAEILLPPDDKSFSLKATPIPEMVANLDDHRPAVGPDGQPIMGKPPTPPAAAAPTPAPAPQPQPAAPGGAAAPAPAPVTPAPAAGQPPAPGPAAPAPAAPQPLTIADLAQQIIDQAQDAADKAEKRIYDWMVECNFVAENRKVIFDAGRLGAGCLKSPFPEVRRSQAAEKQPDNTIKLIVDNKLRPASKWIDVWNLFPDGACGEDIHDGDFVFERDYLTRRRLLALKTSKGYLVDQIDRVVKEGPGKCDINGTNPNEKKHKNRFEIWYYYGTLTRKEMLTAGVEEKDLPPGTGDIYAIATMVNDTIIRATLNPMDSGKFPFHVMPWSRRAGYWAGVGIAEQISLPQRMINAYTRAMLNNAGNSCGPQFVIDRTAIEPATPNDWTIRPNKIWFKSGDGPMTDVRAAMGSINIQNVGAEMMQGIQYALQLAEESCNIPLISQGQTGPDSPETLGATQIQNSNANTLLRAIGNVYDDTITEPVVHGYYEYLLMDPEVPVEEKGDFQIDAHGSAALVERAIQDQTLAQMAPMVANPAYGADPKKWFAEWLRSKRLDPRKIQYTEQEQQQMAQNQQPPVEIQVAQINAASREKVAGMDTQGANGQPGAPDPRAQAAQINANARVQEAQIRAQSEQSVEQSRAAAEKAYADTEAQIARDNALAKHQERQDQRELLILEYSLKNNMQLGDVKADLAKTAMNNDTKRDLALASQQLVQSENANDRAHDIHKQVIQTPAPPDAGIPV